ncbi:MAG TPA: HAMP domain-containing sensor histidine kinase [Acidimicrobiia bacterium]|nr:HAMP domain-containing sensor histidine kinase [Acidimicrobiia bacterium]
MGAVTIAFGACLVAGWFRPDWVLAGSVIYSMGSAGGGLLIMAAAGSLRGRARNAWLLVGAGVLCWGIGETVWNIQSATSGEIPYPGPADFFYVAGYPLLLWGVILLPYLRPGRYERIRLTIDAVAGALSLGVVMWVLYLSRVVTLDPTLPTLDLLLGLFYPFGDVLLAMALMILAMRRSEAKIDLRIILLAVAVAFTTVADVVFALQVAADTYVEWQWVDGLYLLAYGPFALLGWAITRPARRADETYRSVRGWQLLAPYTAVALLFGLRLVTATGNDLLLNLATTGVTLLVVLRQAISIRERRELLEKQRDDLVASVSHELRTPLTGIQGYAQLLTDSWESFGDQDKKQMVGTIGDEAAHLGKIVTDLIDVARHRLQNVKLDRAPVKAADLARGAVASAAGHRKVTLELDEEVWVEADSDRIHQVLVNLITNAVRYGRGGIKVTVRSEESQAWLAVHDNGPGVPSKHQQDIWERFERGAHKFDATVPGSGIGLSVARDLVNAHGGTIRYRPSDELGGACFEFTLPLLPAGSLVSSEL